MGFSLLCKVPSSHHQRQLCGCGSWLLAWARAAGEILILLFLKGRRLALSVTTGPLLRDARLESFEPASLAAHGAVKSVGESKADSST